jgi:DNA-binding CsgD family transcriptional regulator
VAGKTPVVGAPVDGLSKRQRQILALILAGSSGEAIARVLFISLKTVETHQLIINQKLNVYSPGQLIRVSALHGLVVAA